MFCDFVLSNKDAGIKSFAKRLGFSNIIFQEDFKSVGLAISKDYTTDRNLVESKKIKILVNLHVNNFNDSLHFRVSGLDHILCKLCAKNNVSIGFSLDTLVNPVLIGRVKQNIKLCRKYNVKMLFFSFAKSKYELCGVNDLISLLKILGMNGKEAKTALKSF
jgi:hypothetical protein